MVKKGGLGKGLDALIPTEGPQEQDSTSGAVYVPVHLVVPNPRQPRQKMNEADLLELASSIKEHGILQPLIVTYDPQLNQYILIAGERRLRASRLAGLEVVPVLIRQATDQQRLELALIENVQRADLTPLETSEAYRQLNEEFNMSHEEIAKRVGKNRTTVTNTLRLLKLPESVRDALAEEAITEGHARALLSLNTPQAQAAALETIVRLGLTVRQTEDLVRRLSGERPTRPNKAPPSPELTSIEERLRTHFGTKVSLQHGKKGGSVVIHYYSDEELESLLKQLLEE
jgi:ParB family chromosome partitioning protein